MLSTLMTKSDYRGTIGIALTINTSLAKEKISLQSLTISFIHIRSPIIQAYRKFHKWNLRKILVQKHTTRYHQSSTMVYSILEISASVSSFASFCMVKIFLYVLLFFSDRYYCQYQKNRPHCNGRLLNTSIGHPTTISRQYRSSATIYYHRHKQRINIPPEAAPRWYRWCTNRLKSNNFSRRRISSPIYAAAQHYHHQLTFKGVGYRCLVGYYATRRQIEAYGGRRWPSFDRRGGGLLLFVRRSGF